MINYEINPEYNDEHQSFVSAKQGMVVTGSVPAAQAGLDMLKAGGNAVDAAIATAAALTVVEPTSNGIGSEMYAIVWINNKLVGLNASGYSPKNLTLENFYKKHQSSTTIPLYDWTPVLVPGSIKGWEALNKAYGKLSLAQCLAPAIALAKDGFIVSPVLAKAWKNAHKKYVALANESTQFDGWLQTFTFDGQPPKTNDIVKLPDHATTLEAVAKNGSDVFYKGNIAKQIVAQSQKYGGFISLQDLSSYDVEWVKPLLVDYHGYQVAELPPNGQGICASMALNILSQLKQPKQKNTQFYHQQIEAMKLALADGLNHVADPRFMKARIDNLLSEPYAKQQAKRIDKQAQIFTEDKPYGSGTVYLATADNQGNMVSLIQSNFTGFGSGMVVENTGIALNNRGACFSLRKDHPNCLGPMKRSYNTIIPGFLLKGDQPIGPFAILGGFMQPQGHIQLLANIIDYKQNPQLALNEPRWQWISKNEIIVEPHFPKHIIKTLQDRGHIVKVVGHSFSFGRAHLIFRSDNGVLVGAKEPRTDSYIACY